MKLKLLLSFLLLFGGIIYAQDTIRTLIITEARMDHHYSNYIEISNVGDFDIQLNEFEFGLIRPFGGNILWEPETSRRFMLPERILEPGESFVLATAFDFSPLQFAKGVDKYAEKITKDKMWDLGDILLHHPEALYGEAGDSVTEPIYWTFESQNGRGCWFLRQHLSETDSVVVDQVGGVFDMESGLNNPDGRYDVAGVAEATANSVLIRNFNVKEGNIDFAKGRGIGLEDSEWIPVPHAGGAWRDPFWTVGNHGDYKLDENTLESDVIDVDFANKTLTVPWGTRSNDDIIRNFKQKPGIAWEYIFSSNYEDSTYMAARNGDKLRIYVCGNGVDVATFDIIVSEPTAQTNIVVPKYNIDPDGNWRDLVDEGEVTWPRITRYAIGQDTITGARFGLPYATRIDSLLERLDKAPLADWELVTVDGGTRPDLKEGDILKVTAGDGSIKEYYIQVQAYRPSLVAELSAITWPDIPEIYKDFLGWKGDTIPGFSPTSYNYSVKVPLDYHGIPALVPKTEDLNAKINVKRATSLSGSKDQRTTEFMVQAEDDTTFRFYNVELVKEKDPRFIQPYFAEPFISEYVFWWQWSPTNLFEICNPGNQPLDLSNYMFVTLPYGNPADAVKVASGVDDFGQRYKRYIPGYKWGNSADWAVSPSILEFDINVNPIVQPGDVFTIGSIAPWKLGAIGKVRNELDICFTDNPWGENVHFGANVCSPWKNHNWYLFKILNDSIKLGLKPVGDPSDFMLIDVLGTGDGSDPQPGTGYFDMVANISRKPQFYEGRTGFNESFTKPPGSEWDYKNYLGYWIPNGVYNAQVVTWDIGSHYFIEPTHYKSTVTSIVYKISDGYKTESLRGPKTGTTAAEIMANVVKANDGQTLKVVSSTGGAMLSDDALVATNDTLLVLSADSTNTTKYVLEVTEMGLSSDALLTSSKYNIVITAAPKSANDNYGDAGKGEITGFEYGTSLKTLLANISVPEAALLSIVDDAGAYVPLQRLNFDTIYVPVTVNSNTFFEVLAEDGITKIIYQLLPDASEKDAFVTSDLYEVLQKAEIIKLVPRGTNVQAFLSNLVATAGATIKLVDKYGNERADGYVADDDKIVVTSANGSNFKSYFISKLATEHNPFSTYLAYIQSKIYNVNQVYNEINGVSTTETISEFYSKIITALGANATIIDKDGAAKTTGDIDATDRVMVVAADGKTTVYYSFGQLTGVENEISQEFNLYPNPNNGTVNISGLERGQKINVYSSAGLVINQINVTRNLEIIDMNNHPTGVYFIVISDDNNVLARFKAIRR